MASSCFMIFCRSPSVKELRAFDLDEDPSSTTGVMCVGCLLRSSSSSLGFGVVFGVAGLGGFVAGGCRKALNSQLMPCIRRPPGRCWFRSVVVVVAGALVAIVLENSPLKVNNMCKANETTRNTNMSETMSMMSYKFTTIIHQQS